MDVWTYPLGYLSNIFFIKIATNQGKHTILNTSNFTSSMYIYIYIYKPSCEAVGIYIYIYIP